MPRMGLEPTILVFEQAKTVHALDRASTVIGAKYILEQKIFLIQVVVKNETTVSYC
jgi:hypothetical protein